MTTKPNFEWTSNIGNHWNLLWFDQPDKRLCVFTNKHLSETIMRLQPPPSSSAKLYYTSFWDKFGINSIYFGMHPKNRKQFGIDPNLRPFQTPTNHSLWFRRDVSTRQIYLEYLGSIKMRDKDEISIWSIWMWIQWETKFRYSYGLLSIGLNL